MELIGANTKQGQKAMQDLFATVESNNLSLAKHADGWSWSDVKAHKGS
jgi:hypothetical protein